MTDEVLTPREVLLRLNIEKQKKLIEALRFRIDKLRRAIKSAQTGLLNNGIPHGAEFLNLILTQDDHLAESRHE